MTKLRRRSFLLLLLVPLVLAACGAGPSARPREASRGDLTTPFADAFREEAKGDPAVAKQLYLKLLDAAAPAEGNPWQLPVVAASLDALVLRSIRPLEDVTSDPALAFRTTGELPLANVGGNGPFVPGLVARALVRLAERRGDAAAAEYWRGRAGCAREATVTGPLTWMPVTGLTEVDPLERFDARIDASYATPGPFGTKRAPVLVRGRSCTIDLAANGAAPGVRDVVVDVEIAKAQRIGVVLRSRGAALLRAGGKVVLERPYELGGGEAARFARVDAEKGLVRLVARVGLDEDGESVEIDAWDSEGAPLPMHAPRVGEAANAKVSTSFALEIPAPKTDAERLAGAAFALAEGSSPLAERIVEHAARPANAPPELALIYARAVEQARDLSLVHRTERARAAYERVLEVWPTAWEAITAHAMLAGVRRGQGEARIETLRDLDTYRATAGPFALPVIDAFDAVTSGKGDLFDRARAAYARAASSLGGTPLLVDAGRRAFERVGVERETYLCNPAPPHDRRSLECYEARRARGDFSGAARELERVRLVRGGPDLLLALSLRDALVTGDGAEAKRVFGDMLPGELTLSGTYAVSMADDGVVDLHERARLFAVMTTSRDAPSSLPGLLRALGDDPTAAFAGVAESLVAEGRARAIMPAAPTAILTRRERYDVDPSGVTHAVVFDLRRVSGTTDVEENAQAEPPDVVGRTALRVLRRRIFKKDGRIVEPDRTPHASQSHADLSQLEAGDVVEAIYESWAVPGDTGDISIDTPDMLPERTAVHDATIELRLPATLRSSVWSHPLLGKAVESTEEGRRVLRWSMKDTAVRRIENGTPKMDRSVNVSFSTSQWSGVARGLKEAIAALDAHDPETAAWANEVAATAKSKTARGTIEAITDAAGTRVKESSIALLSDLGLGRVNGPQSTTSRTILTNHEGSRTWLIVRALRELGIRAEVVVAENEPYSADPAFPPHAGRFMHPLVVAWAGAEPVWIDADVPGPPLPAGRISPELRGQSGLYADGTIAKIAATGGDDERDEVDVRLAVDTKGDAKGTFTIILRGKDAQEIAEALFRTVGDERQRALRAVALAWVPFANVDDATLSSSEGSWQIAIRAELSIGAYAQIEGATPATRSWVLPGIDPLHQVFPRGSTATLGATYVSQGQRENALAVSRAVQYHAHRRVDLPAGASIARMPGPFEVKTANLEASRRISVAGNVVEDDFVLGIPTATVSADRYATFVADAHHTDDAFLASTRVKPPR